MKTSALVSWILCLLVLSLVVASCDYESTFNVEPTQKEKGIKTNQPPTFAYIETAFDTVAVCNYLDLTCVVEDPENDSCTYEWESFKVTEESTEEDYELDYFMNKGEFIKEGKDAVWEPGKIDGKYLVFCIAKDKGGYEIVAKKIVNVNLESCLSLTTDKTIYKISEVESWGIEFNSIIRNYSKEYITVNACGSFISAIEKRKESGWILFRQLYWGCNGEIPPYSTLEPGWQLPTTFYLHLTEGTYRFIAHYKNEYWGVFTDTLYSNEFKVVE